MEVEPQHACGHAAWNLTDREVEVLTYLAGGHTSESTAAALDLSVHTVVRHVSNMQARTGAPNRLWLVARAFCSGVLTPGIWPPTPSGLRCLNCVHSLQTCFCPADRVAARNRRPYAGSKSTAKEAGPRV